MVNLKKIIMGPKLYLAVAGMAGLAIIADIGMTQKRVDYLKKEFEKNQYKIKNIEKSLDERSDIYKVVGGASLGILLLGSVIKDISNRGKQRTIF